jgi:peptidoglycan/LPS O-acetylase OafA/YrhL
MTLEMAPEMAAELARSDTGGPESKPLDSPSNMGYRPALDGLRALAIGLVLAEHTGLEVFDGGNSGVVIFFVLSGFLITKLMLEEWGRTGGLDVRAFYGRRLVRIMPAPLVLAVVMFLLSWHVAPDATNRHYLWFELFMVVFYLTNLRPLLFGDGSLWGASYRPVGQDRFFAHTWSLSIEEHFYLIWPWVFRRLSLPEADPRKVVRGLAGFVVAVTAVRYVLDRHVNPDLVSLSLVTFDGFAIGACLAFVVHSNLFTRAKLYSANPGLFYLVLIGLTVDLLFRKQADSEPSIGAASAAYHYWYFTTIGIVSLILISHLYHAPQSLAGRLFGWFPVVWLGKLSYSLYLWHVPIQVYVSRDRFPSWGLWQVIAVEQALTFAAALGSYRLVEMPSRRLRKRFVAA